MSLSKYCNLGGYLSSSLMDVYSTDRATLELKSGRRNRNCRIIDAIVDNYLLGLLDGLLSQDHNMAQHRKILGLASDNRCSGGVEDWK